MKYGLTDAEFAFINEKLVLPLKKLGAMVYIFGSRARGNHKKFSDVDVLVEYSTDLSRAISELSEQLDDSNFPYKIDIVEARNLAASYQLSVNSDRVKL